MLTDIEIQKKQKLQPIEEIAKKLGLSKNDIALYGKDKAKILNCKQKKDGKLILVTAINPTKYGEGKTTMSIGLADGLAAYGKKVCLALREPSLGPVFGVKGGATGGGYAQVCPLTDINLHFTGDFHAISAANNLISALVDNHIFQGNKLNIDKNRVLIARTVDMNDRALREIEVAMTHANTKRKDSFVITAASEIMSILVLAKDFEDLKRRLGNILVAYTLDDKEVYLKDLKGENAAAILLKDAIYPNLVQTLEGTPAIIHAGPFANIAPGTNSIIATKTALSLADYVVTEAGFGADLGAEKFLNIKAPLLGKMPDLIVLVLTLKAIKHNGYAKDVNKKDLKALETGFVNVKRHIQNLKKEFGANVLCVLNKFGNDNKDEIDKLKEYVEKENVPFAVSTSFSDGSAGAKDFTNQVLNALKKNKKPTPIYVAEDSVEEKIKKVATRIYKAKNIIYSQSAKKTLEKIRKTKHDEYAVCIAKTQYSFSDNPDKLGAPEGFDLQVQDLEIKAGAELIVAVTGTIYLMPGLPKEPNSQKMIIDNKKEIKQFY